MSKVKLEILGLSSSHSQSGSFALVLGEETGTRRLPIIIGMFEAQAIAIEMEKIVSNRPMTHDLFKSFAQAFAVSVQEVVISDLKEGVFYAKLVCSSNGAEVEELDARPSDAIAIGLRFNVPIYAEQHILEEAGIVLSDMEEDEEGSELGGATTTADPVSKLDNLPSDDPAGMEKALRDVPTEQLRAMIQTALEKEDYEKAAKIRDELDRRA